MIDYLLILGLFISVPACFFLSYVILSSIKYLTKKGE